MEMNALEPEDMPMPMPMPRPVSPEESGDLRAGEEGGGMPALRVCRRSSIEEQEAISMCGDLSSLHQGELHDNADSQDGINLGPPTGSTDDSYPGRKPIITAADSSAIEQRELRVDAAGTFSSISALRRQTESQKRRNEFKMLTSSQLADLFRRLDSDNNGELDLAEFLAMAKKLNLPKYLGLKEEHEAEQYMKSIFREVDTAETGTFDIEEFISAYLMVLTHTQYSYYVSDANSSPLTNKLT